MQASLEEATTYFKTQKYCDFLLGLDVDGIYRVSGNLAVIQKLRFAVNHGKIVLSIVMCENTLLE